MQLDNDNPLLFWHAQKVLKETVDNSVRICVWRMVRAVGHTDSLLVSQDLIDSNQVI